MKKLFKYLIIISFYSLSLPSYSDPITAGFVINEAKDAANSLIENAFDRLDLTLLKAAMEARSVVNESTINLQYVKNSTIDQLDGQQKRVISDLQNFERLVSTDASRALLEIRKGTNRAISDLRLILSKNPGAIIISPGYALEGENYIDFEVQGTALSKARLKNTKFNLSPHTFNIIRQTDIAIVIRIPLNNAKVSQLLKNSRGKPAKANISFEFVEYSWFDLFETGRRRFSEIGYIMPINIGTAKAVFSGLIEEKERKEKRTVCETPVAEVNYVSWSGRKRGKKSGSCLLATDPGGWLIETNSAKYTYKFIKKHKGCNGRRSSATWEKNSPTAVSVKTTVVTHKGRNSTCSAKTTVNFWQWRPTSRNIRLNTSVQKITTSNDIQFRLSASDSKILKRSRLIHVEVTSPLFGNGTRVIRPNESRGAFKLDFNAAAQIGYLRFAYIK